MTIGRRTPATKGTRQFEDSRGVTRIPCAAENSCVNAASLEFRSKALLRASARSRNPTWILRASNSIAPPSHTPTMMALHGSANATDARDGALVAGDELGWTTGSVVF